MPAPKIDASRWVKFRPQDLDFLDALIADCAKACKDYREFETEEEFLEAIDAAEKVAGLLPEAIERYKGNATAKDYLEGLKATAEQYADEARDYIKVVNNKVKFYKSKPLELMKAREVWPKYVEYYAKNGQDNELKFFQGNFSCPKTEKDRKKFFETWLDEGTRGSINPPKGLAKLVRTASKDPTKIEEVFKSWDKIVDENKGVVTLSIYEWLSSIQKTRFAYFKA
jgi:hypothetical protein